jgi:hypothetical protein
MAAAAALWVVNGPRSETDTRETYQVHVAWRRRQLVSERLLGV